MKLSQTIPILMRVFTFFCFWVLTQIFRVKSRLLLAVVIFLSACYVPSDTPQIGKSIFEYLFSSATLYRSEATILQTSESINRIDENLLRIKLNSGDYKDFQNVSSLDVDENVNYRMVAFFENRYALIRKTTHECQEVLLLDIKDGTSIDVEKYNLLSPDKKYMLSYSYSSEGEYYCMSKRVALISLEKGKPIKVPLQETYYRWGIKQANWSNNNLIHLLVERYVDPIEGGKDVMESKYLKRYGEKWLYQSAYNALSLSELQQYREQFRYQDYKAVLAYEIDGKSPKEIIHYYFREKTGMNYAGVYIKTVSGNTLWSDRFPVSDETLAKLIRSSGSENMEDWVKNYFSNDSEYAFSINRQEDKSGRVLITYFESDYKKVQAIYSETHKKFLRR